MPDDTTTTDPATPLKRWSIRRYYTYVDEYHVEAETLEKANANLDTVLDTMNALTAHFPRTVTRVQNNEYVDYDGSQGNEIDTDGNWVGDPEDL